LELRLAAADVVIFLDLARTLCLWRAIKRRLVWRGRDRPDVGAGCPERLTMEYLLWIWRYPQDNGPGTLELMARHSGHQQQFRLRSRREVASFVKECANADRSARQELA
jgi:adenylate kinase family enzyme